eukprot:TRINITY_DN3015_c0_g1_i1.p1 TRINITY_DN3015_c0_g1~~TRINITY_DN3015_c0_g1_i1.p1  ORF type:complete len:156 (+),score=38.89 TRINITY_DN3015_c0_g1_i1:122-589(+)
MSDVEKETEPRVEGEEGVEETAEEPSVTREDKVGCGRVMAEMFYENFALTMKPMTEVLSMTSELHKQIIEHLMANRAALAQITQEGNEVTDVFERIPAYTQKLHQICERMKQATEKAANLKANSLKAEAMKRAELEAFEQKLRNEKAFEDKLTAT